MADRYFVKGSADAPEKGPFTLESLRQSFDGQLVKQTAIVRKEGGDATQTLAQLFGLGGNIAEPTREERERSKMFAEFAQNEMDANVRRAKSAGNTNMIIGLVMIVAGVGLTVASFSAAQESGGRYVAFFGLVIFGLVRLVRGAASR